MDGDERDEETPTKRRSGAYGMMTEACADTERDLETLLANPKHAHLRGELTGLLDEIRALRRAVTRWPKPGMDEATKSTQIQRIIDITQRAQLLGTK